MTQATTRMTFGAILGAVSTTANTVGNLLNGLNSGINMANTVITDAATKQRIDSKADIDTYKYEVKVRKSYEKAESVIKVQQYCAQSPEHKAAFEKAFSEMEELLKDI